MRIISIQPTDNKQINFQYSDKLKTLFRKGLLPTVKVDVMGNKLTKKNVTLDHIIPKSKGGKSWTGNYMLADKDFNSERGNAPLSNWMTKEGLIRYLNQFTGIRIGDFIGNEYIAAVIRTLKKANELGV